MAELRVAFLPGDGIGPEITAAAERTLARVANAYGHTLNAEHHVVGYVAWEEKRSPLPDETLAACLSATAVFLGAVGDPRARDLDRQERPEAGLLRLRSELGCFANLRPARVDPELVGVSALRPDLAEGVDFVIVRELNGGLYYGEPRRWATEERRAINTLVYAESEVERIAEVAFDLARRRRRRLVSVDKANVLEVSQLWRDVVTRVSGGYPDVELDHMYVDRAAMELVTNPAQFDVILTSNLFGDILSDEAAAICGSLGLLGSASVGGSVGIYEPVHGSAPDLAGKGIANPIGAIRSAAMMLRHSFDLRDEADAVEQAVGRALAGGARTADLSTNGSDIANTETFTTAVLEELR